MDSTPGPSAGAAPGGDAQPDAVVSPHDLTGWTLVQTAHLVGRRFHEVFASQGLTAHQFGVLVQLSRRPGLSQAALARGVLVTPQSIGEIIGQMELAELILRTPPARRGGPISVQITSAGRATLERTYPLVGALNAPAALGLDPAEAVTLNRLLHRVHDHLDDRPFTPLPHGV